MCARLLALFAYVVAVNAETSLVSIEKPHQTGLARPHKTFSSLMTDVLTNPGSKALFLGTAGAANPTIVSAMTTLGTQLPEYHHKAAGRAMKKLREALIAAAWAKSNLGEMSAVMKEEAGAKGLKIKRSNATETFASLMTQVLANPGSKTAFLGAKAVGNPQDTTAMTTLGSSLTSGFAHARLKEALLTANWFKAMLVEDVIAKLALEEEAEAMDVDADEQEAKEEAEAAEQKAGAEADGLDGEGSELGEASEFPDAEEVAKAEAEVAAADADAPDAEETQEEVAEVAKADAEVDQAESTVLLEEENKEDAEEDDDQEVDEEDEAEAEDEEDAEEEAEEDEEDDVYM